MKLGLRRPSPRESLAARTSWRRHVRHGLGLKAPRGRGWRVPTPTAAHTPVGAVTDPRRAAYGRVHNRTTSSWRRVPALAARVSVG